MSKVNDETPSIRTAAEVNQKNKDYWQPSWGPQPESDDQQRNPTGVARDIEYKGLDADAAVKGLEPGRTTTGTLKEGSISLAKRIGTQAVEAAQQGKARVAKKLATRAAHFAGHAGMNPKDSSPTGLGEAGEHEGMAQDEADSTFGERRERKNANPSKIKQAGSSGEAISRQHIAREIQHHRQIGAQKEVHAEIKSEIKRTGKLA